MEFTPYTFRGHTADITPIIDNFTTPDYLNHYHIAMHGGNTRLGRWAKRVIEDNVETPVLYLEKGRHYFLPESEFPGNSAEVVVSKSFPKRVYVRLSKLPCKYSFMGAVDSGITSVDFEKEYNGMVDVFRSHMSDIEKYPGNIRLILTSPDIMSAAYVSYFNKEGVGSNEDVWKHIVFYAMDRLDVPRDKFQDVKFSSMDNCLENFPDDFNYDHLIPLMKEFGGWLDYSPGKRHAPKDRASMFNASMECNFTTYEPTDKVNAVVKYASFSDIQSCGMTSVQRKFANAVYDAYGVSPAKI